MRQTIIKTVFLIYYLLIIDWSAFAQINNLEEKILSGLNTEDIEKLENAREAKAYGDELMNQAKSTETQYGLSMSKKEDYAGERLRQMDEKKINIVRSIVRKKIQASTQYGNSNILTSFVYTKDLKKRSMQIAPLEKEKVNILLEQSKYLLMQGMTIRARAMRLENEFLVYPHLIDANNTEQLSINKLKEAYGYIYGGAKNFNENQARLTEIKYTQNSTGPYYKIQLAATKKTLSDERIKQIAPRNEPVKSEFKNGWYKYSLSRAFSSYQEAANYKKANGLNEAFIIAYINGKRVSVSEAILWDRVQEKHRQAAGNASSGNAFRLRVWISTQPATKATLAGIKSGGMPITMEDHGGWYTYTIGDFSTKQKANRFKKNNGLTDAVLVEYKNGKPARND